MVDNEHANRQGANPTAPTKGKVMRLSSRHPLGASSSAPEQRRIPEGGSAPEDIGEMSPIDDPGLSTPQLSEQPWGTNRELLLPSRAMVERWVLVDCGPDGVRPRRIHDLPGLWDRRPTLH